MTNEHLHTITPSQHAFADAERPPGYADYWYGLNHEKAASRFLGVTPRYMQAFQLTDDVDEIVETIQLHYAERQRKRGAGGGNGHNTP